MTEQLHPGSRERNLGIDLLRCAAMCMIACLHILNHGWVLGASPAANRDWLAPLNVAVNCGVNIYALITGYVTVYGRFRPSRAAELWLQVLFWNLVIAAFGEAVQPHIMDGFWIRYCFPLTQKCFWYFTAYIGVYAFSPLLNRGILALNPRQCKALMLTMLLLFSVGTTVGYWNQGDPWPIKGGYSVLWLMALYVIGACVRHSGFGTKIRRRKLLLILLLLIVGYAVLVRGINRIVDPGEFLKKVRSCFLYYTSPTLAAISICLLILFSRLRVEGIAATLVRFFAPLTFGVYIIHVHHVNWTWIEKRFKPLGSLSPPLTLLSVIGSGIGLFLACALLDWLRSVLFRRLQISQRLKRLEAKLMARLQGASNENP